MFETKYILPYRQQGASLITAVFLITALAVLGALTTKLSQFSQTKTIKEWHAAQSLYAAESAVSAAAYDIISNDNCVARPATNVSIDTNSAGTYSVMCTQPGQSGKTVNLYQITATGTAGSGDFQTQRQIIVQFIP